MNELFECIDQDLLNNQGWETVLEDKTTTNTTTQQPNNDKKEKINEEFTLKKPEKEDKK